MILGIDPMIVGNDPSILGNDQPCFKGHGDSRHFWDQEFRILTNWQEVIPPTAPSWVSSRPLLAGETMWKPQLIHSQDPVVEWSTQNHAKLFMAGIVPAITFIYPGLIVAQLKTEEGQMEHGALRIKKAPPLSCKTNKRKSKVAFSKRNVSGLGYTRTNFDQGKPFALGSQTASNDARLWRPNRTAPTLTNLASSLVSEEKPEGASSVLYTLGTIGSGPSRSNQPCFFGATWGGGMFWGGLLGTNFREHFQIPPF